MREREGENEREQNQHGRKKDSFYIILFSKLSLLRE
jgi:hypothetical protein